MNLININKLQWYVLFLLNSIYTVCNGLWPSKQAVNTGVHANKYVSFVHGSSHIFNICALILNVCEGSSQPIANSLFITKHAKNYGIYIFDHEGL